MAKHAIMVWMAVLNRLPTKDKIKSWGSEVNDVCELCRSAGETRDHLFYGCIFSQQIRNEILLLCGHTRRVSSWNGKLQRAMQRLKGRSLASVILRIAWHAMIYYTWLERNNGFHKGKVGTIMQVLEKIEEVIRIRLMGLKNVKVDFVIFS